MDETKTDLTQRIMAGVPEGTYEPKTELSYTELQRMRYAIGGVGDSDPAFRREIKQLQEQDPELALHIQQKRRRYWETVSGD